MSSLRDIGLQTITEQHLLGLVSSGAEESRTLDAKRDMYGNSDGDKREFLKDLSSFANTIGGDLLIGVDEVDSVLSAVPGLEGDRDNIQLRLEQLAANNLMPRIPGLEFRAITLASGRFIVAVRVPRSWAGPHRVEAQDYRFYYRTEKGTERMDVDQLRAAFLAGPEFAQRAREYRADRISKIVGGAPPIPLLQESAVILHILPRDVFGGPRLTGARLRRELENLRPPSATSVQDIRFNLEGVLGYSGGQTGPAAAYAHISRYGAYEGVRSNIVRPPQHKDAPPHVLVANIERAILTGARSGLAALQSLGREAPYAVFITLIGVRGAHYAPEGFAQDDAIVRGFDRDVVLGSDELIYQPPQTDSELYGKLKPLLDEIANAAGWTQSPNRIQA